MEEKKYAYKYPHPSVTADCIIFGFDGGKLKVLLIERGQDPYKGKWAFPGGFVQMDESCEEGALRELEEETALKGMAVQQFHTYSDPNRDPRERVITVAFLALVRLQEVKAGDDARKERIHFQPIGFELLPEKFTMRQLQNLYESILDVHFDRGNFSKKMLHFNILTPLDETVKPTPKREARLYRFNKESYDELKQKGFRLEF